MTQDFTSWLLDRVAQAVEAGEVPVELLTALRADIAAATELPQGEGEATVIRQIADIVGISEAKAGTVLAALDAGTTVARPRLLRWIAEAWLRGHQERYRQRPNPPGQ